MYGKKLHIRSLFIFVVIALLIASCAQPGAEQGAAPTEAPAPGVQTTTQAQATQPPAQGNASVSGLPDYYPSDYNQIVDACKNEKDGLLIYSIMGEKNWAPVIAAFNQRYPGVEVTALDLGSYEVFERYYSEAAGNARTGDMIITSAPDGWQDFIAKGDLVEYTSPEDSYLPDWSKLAPGVYTVSSDPMVIIYNKQLVQNPPDTMAGLADLVKANPDQFKGKITTYDAENVATGFAINWFWVKKLGDKAWEILNTIGDTSPTIQSSAGRMVDATLAGESTIGYFVSTISVFPRFPDAEPVLGWNFIKDGQPILVRGMGITKKASSPNCAKLMMDFILSQEGQIKFAEGGLTPYRPDVADKVDFHLKTIEQEVGADNLIPFSFDPELMDQAKKDAFLAKWKEALKIQ